MLINLICYWFIVGGLGLVGVMIVGFSVYLLAERIVAIWGWLDRVAARMKAKRLERKARRFPAASVAGRGER